MYLCSLPPTATDHESIYRKVVIPSLLQCISGPPITRPFTRRSSFLTSTSASLGPIIMRAFTRRSSFLTSSSASRGPPSHESIYLKVIIRPWTADAIEAIPVELPTRFQCPESLFSSSAFTCPTLLRARLLWPACVLCTPPGSGEMPGLISWL